MISYSIDSLAILMYIEIFEQNIFQTFSLKKLFNIEKYSYFFKKCVLNFLHFNTLNFEKVLSFYIYTYIYKYKYIYTYIYILYFVCIYHIYIHGVHIYIYILHLYIIYNIYILIYIIYEYYVRVFTHMCAWTFLFFRHQYGFVSYTAVYTSYALFYIPSSFFFYLELKLLLLKFYLPFLITLFPMGVIQLLRSYKMIKIWTLPYVLLPPPPLPNT